MRSACIVVLKARCLVEFNRHLSEPDIDLL